MLLWYKCQAYPLLILNKACFKHLCASRRAVTGCVIVCVSVCAWVFYLLFDGAVQIGMKRRDIGRPSCSTRYQSHVETAGGARKGIREGIQGAVMWIHHSDFTAFPRNEHTSVKEFQRHTFCFWINLERYVFTRGYKHARGSSGGKTVSTFQEQNNNLHLLIVFPPGVFLRGTLSLSFSLSLWGLGGMISCSVSGTGIFTVRLSALSA